MWYRRWLLGARRGISDTALDCCLQTSTHHDRFDASALASQKLQRTAMSWGPLLYGVPVAQTHRSAEWPKSAAARPVWKSTTEMGAYEVFSSGSTSAAS